MLPRCWQAVTAPDRPTPPTGPPAHGGAVVAGPARRDRHPRAAPRRPRRSSAGRRRHVRAGATGRSSPTGGRSSPCAGRDDVARDDDVSAGRCRGSPGCSPCRCAGRSPAAARHRPPPHHDHATATPWWAPPDRLDPRALERARPARRGVDVVGVRQHAVHPDRQLRRRRLRRQRQRHRHRRRRSCAPGSSSCCRSPCSPTAIGRRRIVTAMAVAAPLVTAAGALAPTFPFLVATQAIGRPLGLALDFLVAVVAAEEMPRNSRAYAVSVLAMASGLGAGVAVMALPLADISAGSWRLVYLVALVWLVVAVDIARRLPGDPALRAPARRRPADRPPPLRRPRRRRPARQPVRRPGQPVPERLPQGRPRLLGAARSPSSRSLTATPAGDRADHRRARRRRARAQGCSSPPSCPRRRSSGCLLHRRRPGDVDRDVPRRLPRRRSRTRRSPSTAPSCSRPATGAGRPAC